MLKITLFVICLFPLLCQGQRLPAGRNLTDAAGQRQNDWVVWMDGHWQVTSDSNNVVYYRRIRYENDKPVGPVADYYRNNGKQYEGHLLADRPEDVPDGKQTWYYPDGKPRIIENYDKGSPIGDPIVLLRSGKPADESWVAHYRQGEKLSDEKDYTASAYEFLVALENAEAFLGRETEDYAFIADWLGIVYGLASRKEEAIFYKEEFVSVRKILRNPPDTLMASTLSVLGSYYRQTRNFTQAKRVLLEFQKYNEQYFNGTHPDISDAMQTLGTVHQELREYDDALACLLQVRHVVEKNKKDAGNLGVRNTLVLSGLYLDLGEHTKGEQLLAGEIKDIRKQYGAGSEIYWTALGLLARIHTGSGQYALAETEWKEVLGTIRSNGGPQSAEYASVLGSLAELQIATGKPLEADQLINEAKAIYEKQQTQDVFYFQFLSKLLNVYAAMGDTEEVMATAKTMQAVAKKLYGETSLQYAEASLKLADAAFTQRLWDKVIEYGQDGLRIYSASRTNLNEHENTTQALLETRLGSGYLMKILAAPSPPTAALARTHIDRALCIFDSFPKKVFSINITDTYLLSAMLYELAGEYERADKIYTYVYENVRKQWGEHHPYLIDLLFLIAKKSELRKDLGASSGYYQKAVQRHAEYVNNVLPYLGETEKENFYATNKQVLLGFHGFASQYAGKVNGLAETWCDVVLAQKGIILKSFNPMRQAVFASSDASLKKHFADWQKLRDTYGKMLRDTTSTEDALKKMATTVGALEKKIASSGEKMEFNPGQVTWKDVQKVLKQDEAAVEIMYTIKENEEGYDTAYYAIVIRPGYKEPLITRLASAATVEGRQLRFYRNAIRFRQVDTTSYNVYWNPMASLLKDTRTVYFSPDGVYHQINPSTLFDPEAGKFLSDIISIRTIPSASWLADKVKHPQDLKDLTFFAHPDYGGTPSKKMDATRSLDLQAVTELPGTRLELDDLGALMDEHHIPHHDFEGMAATEEAMKQISKPSVLHIATHGYFLPAVHNSKGARNPLLRSGLLLADCQRKPHLLNDSRDDGVLTAFEASSLPLYQTRLVVLSACETGLGDVKNGEGVYGLQRAFFQAGAQRILMSLWKVDDEATHEFMVSFYQNWIKTGDIGSAFQYAQAYVKANHPEPFYWGAFVLNGN